MNNLLKRKKLNGNEKFYNSTIVDPNLESLKITVLYGLVGLLWVLLSDRILVNLVKDPLVFKIVQTYKGWLYVLLTMLMVYLLIKSRLSLLQEAMYSINYSYEELSTTYEKLISTEEELREKFNEIENSRNELVKSNLRYKLVVEGSKEGIWEWDSETKTYYFSIKTKDILGYANGEIDDSFEAWEQLVHPEDREVVLKKLSNYFESKNKVYEGTYRLRAKNGEYRWILSRGEALRDDNGNVVRMGGSHTDITEQLNLRATLKREVILSENVMNNVSVIIVIWDNKGRVLRFNKCAERTLGYTEDEVLGKSVLDLFTFGKNRDDLYSVYQRIKAGEVIGNLESKFLRKDGKFVDLIWNSSILYRENSKIIEMISVGTDITERKEIEERLHSLAYKDSLTGVPNRTSFQEKVKQLTEDTKCNNFAIIYMDIDNFKHINDTLGHSSGDKLLKYVCEVLSNNINGKDALFRLGGDEFALILEEYNNNKSIVDKLEYLIQKLRKAWIYKNQEFFISLSIGIVIYPDHGLDFLTLFKNADTAMYCAKESGKDNYCFYDENIQAKTLEYIKMVNQLRNAIEKEEFLLYYQPQINLKAGRITAVEALIRWNHPVKGFISPLDFIPIAESTGQIQQITQWVVRTACKQKKEWDDKGYNPIKMSINFSGKCFTRHNIVGDLRNLLDSLKINYNEIQLEITETAFMSDLNMVTEIVSQLRELGIQIALDDFGTGYSSLTYLKKLPIDVLKMDRGFVQSIKNQLGNQDEIITTTIIQLAKALRLNIVAEGIETKEQLMFLRNHGCEEVQGYYFSKPVPPHMIEKLLCSNYHYLTNDHNVDEFIFTHEKEVK